MITNWNSANKKILQWIIRSMTWSTASESTILGSTWPYLIVGALVTWAKLLEPTAPSHFTQQIFFCLRPRRYGTIRTCIAPELDYVIRSSMQLSNHTRNEAMHSVSAHQLSRYYKHLELLWSLNVRSADEHVQPKYCKTFDSLYLTPFVEMTGFFFLSFFKSSVPWLKKNWGPLFAEMLVKTSSNMSAHWRYKVNPKLFVFPPTLYLIKMDKRS